jgi:hypothetical protein
VRDFDPVYVRFGSWLCENSSARRARRNISKKSRIMESNDAARAMFGTLFENYIFYILPMYEFLHSQGQTRPFGHVRRNVRFARKRTRLGDLWARRYRVGREGFLSTVVTVTPNFALLEMNHPEVASLVAAMLQARDAVERRSWSHPQEPTGEGWWADVLDETRARTGRDAQED